jgi:hypothetical protein
MEFAQKVPVNLVFVGYDEADIDTSALLAELPDTYDPVVRYPRFYGLPGRDIGLHFEFVFDVKFAKHQFEDGLFNYMMSIGTEGPMTSFQQDYNDQTNNVLDVTDPVLYIDGPSVEGWLQTNKNMLGLNNERAYTIFFVNWYDRPDFQFHVYTKTDEPDPDTGYNFGIERASRKMIAWGGTHGRTWFYDLSAGPEAWTDNWNVDDPDLNGNGFVDYRMPPIWEYTAGGFRAPDQLSSDLGLVTRFVGIDLLFTPSPLYDPMVTAPGQEGMRVNHIEMFEDDPAASGLDWIDPAIVQYEWSEFQPYYGWETYLEDNDPIDAGAQDAFYTFTGFAVNPGCWTAYGTPFAELFCYFDANYASYVPAYGEDDYVGTVFSFNTTDAHLAGQLGLLGFADDDWVSGTQTYVFQFDAPFYRTLGYGFTGTTIHELGHHYGLSHPHDGYDSELDLDFGASDGLYFVWSGNEADSVMHYMVLSNGFGQFNQDTMYRLEFEGYLNWSNALLGQIEMHPDARDVQRYIARANGRAAVAISAFDRWDYLTAVTNARKAYVLMAMAADELGIPTPDATIQALPMLSEQDVPHEGDPIRFPNN